MVEHVSRQYDVFFQSSYLILRFANIGQRRAHLVSGQFAHGVDPTDSVGSPAFIGGYIWGGVVKSAGADLEPFGDRRIKKHQWSPTVATERALAFSMHHGFWVTLGPRQSSALEKGPRNKWRAAGFLAVGAMAEGGLDGRALERVTHGPTQATAMDFLTHSRLGESLANVRPPRVALLRRHG